MIYGCQGINNDDRRKSMNKTWNDLMTVKQIKLFAQESCDTYRSWNHGHCMKFSPKSTNGTLAPHRYICFVSNIVTILTKIEIIVIMILGLSDSWFVWFSIPFEGVLRFPDAHVGVWPERASDCRGGLTTSLLQGHLAHSCNLYLNAMFNYKYRYL